MSAIIFTGNRVLTDSKSKVEPATLHVDPWTGRIIKITKNHSTKADFPGIEDKNFVDAGDDLIMPGVIDAHVHLNEPGRTDWEGFDTATRAAAAGGLTTVIDMPLNSIPPTTTLENLNIKKEAAKPQAWVDVGFYGGVIPGNAEQLRPMIAAGVCGFKCFLIESGVDEFPCVEEEDVRKAFAEFDGTDNVFMFHAEMECDDHSHDTTTPQSTDPSAYQTFLQSRPHALEVKAIEMIIRVCKDFPNVRTHIVHLSSAEALPMIRKAKSEGVKLTVETCYHYLTLNAEDIINGATHFKCCPPIREGSNRELLWEALLDGTIDYVVSDHSPCTPELKRFDSGDFTAAWGGISSLQFGLSLLWTEAKRRGCTVQDLTRWLSHNTARHAGILDRKGRLQIGSDADIVIWNPEESFVVDKKMIHFKNKVTPYENMTLNGSIKKTYVRGQNVYDKSTAQLFSAKPLGNLLARL
ncbi:Allantoinase [Basidiobolus ranarum]|uniref:allantoinase n=1 Tax=Basidiobolus ranarum TaxID=34480 RepID=A0ABR2X3M5_9FUNG